MIVGVLTTCRTQYTWDRSICIFLFNRTTLQVFVTYLTGALYVHPLWFYKHQHHSWVHSKLFVACQRWWSQWRFWFVPSVSGYLQEEEEHKRDPWCNPIKRTTYCYLKCVAYDKLLKPRQSFLITMYFVKTKLSYIRKMMFWYAHWLKKLKGCNDFLTVWWLHLSWTDVIEHPPFAELCGCTCICVYMCVCEKKEKHLYSFFFFFSNVNFYI